MTKKKGRKQQQVAHEEDHDAMVRKVKSLLKKSNGEKTPYIKRLAKQHGIELCF